MTKQLSTIRRQDVNKGELIMRKFISGVILVLMLASTSSAVDVPGIVSFQSFLAQSSSNNTLTLFTPNQDGVFRISTYLDFSGNNGNISTTANFTSVNGAASVSNTFSGSNGTNAAYSILMIRSIASNAVTLTIITGNPTPSNYDVYVTIERLK